MSVVRSWNNNYTLRHVYLKTYILWTINIYIYHPDFLSLNVSFCNGWSFLTLNLLHVLLTSIWMYVSIIQINTWPYNIDYFVDIPFSLSVKFICLWALNSVSMSFYCGVYRKQAIPRLRFNIMFDVIGIIYYQNSITSQYESTFRAALTEPQWCLLGW